MRPNRKLRRPALARRRTPFALASRGKIWLLVSTYVSAVICLGLLAADLSKDGRIESADDRQLVLMQRDDQLALSRLHLGDRWGTVHATKSDHSHVQISVAADIEAAALAELSDDTGDETTMRPSLSRDSRTKKIVVGNFLTRSFAGDQSMCFEIGEKMMEDIGAADENMEVLVDSDVMVAIRFCAANGSLVMTCRNEQITISPRRYRPDDGCSASRQISLVER